MAVAWHWRLARSKGGSPEQKPIIALRWADVRHIHKLWVMGCIIFGSWGCVLRPQINEKVDCNLKSKYCRTYSGTVINNCRVYPDKTQLQRLSAHRRQNL
ncbi:hypothetical protein CEXT_217891 [Caerostris extrusa]|uniref:Uncharacterized protein n=1 Tax=Caerostris extrusa TaxID=172846 RepID=A0AAV4PR85_CAEEX|nr:hypothetical protein CEXT_217891 [Caerostris extrusa]